MSKLDNYFIALQMKAISTMNRFGIVLDGQYFWSLSCIKKAIDCYKNPTVFQLGGQYLPGAKYVAFNEGSRLLGEECQILICDFSQDFNANSFNSVLGTLVGGGLLFIFPERSLSKSLDKVWLERSLNRLIVLSQNKPFPSLPKIISQALPISIYQEQYIAIDKIMHVVEGHNKRPLILTSDRGRGKSAALGIAAANLMKSRSIKILITAPSISSINVVFQHALAKLDSTKKTKYNLIYQKSSLLFVSPYELLHSKIKCNFLVVDEAAAIPISMLKTMAKLYCRIIFSSTIHGYEGSGRGFSLKFLTWLKSYRSKTFHLHLNCPIRWTQEDFLERWQYQTFLLNAELYINKQKLINIDKLKLLKFNKNNLFTQFERFKNCFALLVSAHYKTSPNDLFLFLRDDSMHMYMMFALDVFVGCMLVVEEGGVEDDLIKKIQLGEYRPKGKLVSSILAKDIGISEAARQKSLRIMRIAVHPNYQRLGIGSKAIQILYKQTTVNYISTSFGATSELIRFWLRNKFVPIKISSKIDKVSGCYSLIMVRAENSPWLGEARDFFKCSIDYFLTCSLKTLDSSIVLLLLSEIASHTRKSSKFINIKLNFLISNYLEGGGNFDSIASQIKNLINTLPQEKFVYVGKLTLLKIIQQWSWKDCMNQFQLSTRKECELQFKNEIKWLYTNLVSTPD
ncbi:GNAT family N-acetyltransferase [Candidatus Photodesmus anomalopis]|uniref:Acetyltransferase protein n=1 Tax=Candidatus Photodesmus katoptron Akat1 TaxID=1236703 RepID=S3EID7_9GAMM|nr:GNAT family N-acetyltransferase [Candidatus Photodesmus katoptron]EPE37948.1 acetyltransferase protein [Candidatus Photodesmus katoptron Akat1]